MLALTMLPLAMMIDDAGGKNDGKKTRHPKGLLMKIKTMMMVEMMTTMRDDDLNPTRERDQSGI